MTHKELKEAVLAAKKAKGLTWDAIAAHVGTHKVFVTSALLGQNSLSPDMAAKAVEVLGLVPEAADTLQTCPLKGSLDVTVSPDPLGYRFREITQVYGTTIKEIIHEMFGDGIMSAIDFRMDIQKQPDPKGNRVVITFNGKFLPHKKW